MNGFISLALRSTSKQRRSKLSLSNFEAVRGVHRKEGFLASSGRGGTGLQGFGTGARVNTGTQGEGYRGHGPRRSNEQFDHAYHPHREGDDHDLLSVIEEADSMMSASHVGLLAPLQVTKEPFVSFL